MYSEESTNNWNPFIPMDLEINFKRSISFGSRDFRMQQRQDVCCSSGAASPPHTTVNIDHSPDNNLKQKKGENDNGKQQNEFLLKTARDLVEKAEINAGDALKGDCVHVRAKRGQATNSHSLAERVRRKKISERMKLLQDLVPGCNKITAKALMLDEIINYVLSLQRQVEFLSMKLAAVNPELSVDIEQILTISKDSFLLKDKHHAFLAFDQGTSSLHSHLHGSSLPGIYNQVDVLQATLPRISNLTQILDGWEDEPENAI